MVTSYVFVLLIGVIIALLATAFRVLREYQRGVIFMLGRY